jgi:hypothetical protein
MQMVPQQAAAISGCRVDAAFPKAAARRQGWFLRAGTLQRAKQSLDMNVRRPAEPSPGVARKGRVGGLDLLTGLSVQDTWGLDNSPLSCNVGVYSAAAWHGQHKA